ncbi:hypothetical protein LPJ73_009383, partial [Coemansia sp. RSA 2703]
MILQTPHLIPDPQKRASRRLSANDPSPASSPHPTQQEIDQTQEASAPGLYLGSFKRFSKSTTSLPAMLSSHKFGLYDIQLGDYQYYPVETDYKTVGRRAGPRTAQVSMDQPHGLRAARSHHNLQHPDDCGVLSQSMLSMASKIEPMPDVTDLLSPIQRDSYEYEAEDHKATGVITLVSHHHTNDEPPTSTWPPVIPLNNAAEHSAPLAPAAGNAARPRVAAPMPRKQMSMAQLEARCMNRNSMLVSGTLLPAVSMGVADDLAQHSRTARDPPDVQLDKRLRRASRYLYDVPGASLGVQETLNKAFNWPQRLSRATSKRDA